MKKPSFRPLISLLFSSLLFVNMLYAVDNSNDLNKHAPYASKNCGACHTDKKGKSGKLKVEGDALCFKCHLDIKKRVTNSKNKHGAIAMVGCLGCHDPHSSASTKLLKAEDAKSICLTCHSSPLPRDEDGKMLLNMGEHLANNPDLHGPILWGDCAACHNPHGSDNFRMLKQPFPEKSSAAFSVNGYICFKCHEPKKITQRFTNEFTEFRNGEKNIHFLHVKIKRISCKTCHDYHASSGIVHHIKDKTTFGSAKFPLRYIEAPNGGSCNPICHTRRYYNRVEPVNVDTNKKLK